MPGGGPGWTPVAGDRGMTGPMDGIAVARTAGTGGGPRWPDRGDRGLVGNFGRRCWRRNGGTGVWQCHAIHEHRQ